MIEQLLNLGNQKEEIGETVFLFDPGTMSDLVGSNITYTTYGLAVVNTDTTIDGQPTISTPNTSSGIVVTFEQPFNFAMGNWTLEWSEYMSTNPGSNYHAGVCMYTDDVMTGALANGILSRWGNTGFGNRLSVGNIFSSVSTVFNAPVTKATSSGSIIHYALSCRTGKVSFFKDGELTKLAGGTSVTYNQDNYPLVRPIDNLTKLAIGFFTGGTASRPGFFGRVRLSNYARYTKNYIHEPF